MNDLISIRAVVWDQGHADRGSDLVKLTSNPDFRFQVFDEAERNC